jgi:hypothetical protein
MSSLKKKSIIMMVSATVLFFPSSHSSQNSFPLMPPVKINEKNYSRSIKKYINNPKRSSPRNLRWVNVKSAGRITELE